MSTLTSSVINKSGKTVAPKAAPRRRPGRAPPSQPTTKSNGVDTGAGATDDPAPVLDNARSDTHLATPPPTQEVPSTKETRTRQPDLSVESERTGQVDHGARRNRNENSQPSRVEHASDSTSASGQHSTLVTPSTDSGSGKGVSNERRAQDIRVDLSTEAAAGSNAEQDVAEPGPEIDNAESQSAQPRIIGQKRKRQQPTVQATITTEQQASPTPARDEHDEPQALAGSESTADQAQVDADSMAGPKSRRKRQRKQQLSDERITAEDDDHVHDVSEPAVAPVKKTRAKRKTKDVVPSIEHAETDGVNTGQDSPPVVKPKRQRKSKSKSVGVASQRAGNGTQAEGDEQEQGEEEEDPELHEIDINTTTMASLTRDRALGKTSERGKKMAAIDWAEVVRKRREETHLPTPAGTDNGQNGEGQADGESTPAEPQYRGLQLRMVNGEMVLDEESARIDRQAEALEDANHRAQLETEDDLTKKVTRMTWLEKKKRDPVDRVPVYKMKSDPWSDDDTDRFYEALSMFGTDFFIISKMFAPRTRRQIKLKFVREERLDAARVNRALSGDGSKPMDLSVYAEATGQEVDDFRDPEDLRRELELEGQEQRVEIEKKKVEMAEAQKQRDIQMQARDKEKEEREKQKQASKDQRALARQRKKRGIVGTGTF